MPTTKGRLGYADTRGAEGDLTFQYNPRGLEYNRAASYSRNQAAKADFPNSSTTALPAFNWIRNDPEEISIELIFHQLGKRDVEQQLKQLDDFMKPDPTVGKPRPLLFVWGQGRSDRVVILDKRVKEDLFGPDLKCQQATVSLKLGCLISRRSR